MKKHMSKVYGTNFGLALPTELLGKVILVAKFPMEMKVDKEVERPAPPAVRTAATRPDGPLNFELSANCHNEIAPTATIIKCEFKSYNSQKHGIALVLAL